MKGELIAVAVLVIVGNTASAQTKVAVYAVGAPGSAAYERLSFWVKDGRRTAIFYTYGQDRKELKLNYLNRFQLANQFGFKVRFSNGHVLSIIPDGLVLKVSDTGPKGSKSFAWEYEGPVNGIGTFCEPCAEDEKEAMQLMQRYYLK